MKRSFVLYCDYEQHLSLLTMEQRGVLFTAIMGYQNGKDVPEMDNAVAMAFSFIKSQLSRDNERYDEIVKKRSEAGKMGGRPRKQTEAKKANGFSEKQTEAKKADTVNGNDTVNDTDIKEISTSVLTKKGTDGRSDKEAIRKKAQAEFFALYPGISIDNYSAADYADIDFEVLARRFEESAFLRTRYSFSWVCSNYRKIAAGEFKDNPNKKAPPPVRKNALGAEWDDLEG